MLRQGGGGRERKKENGEGTLFSGKIVIYRSQGLGRDIYGERARLYMPPRHLTSCRSTRNQNVSRLTPQSSWLLQHRSWRGESKLRVHVLSNRMSRAVLEDEGRRQGDAYLKLEIVCKKRSA